MAGESTATPLRTAARPRCGRSRRQATGRPLLLAGVVLTCAAACPPALAATGGYGKLIAVGGGGAASAAVAGFRVTSPPRVFWLLVTDSAGTTLNLAWSITCSNGVRERGGAAGRATAGHGRWVRRVRANWISRPTSCSGVVHGSADHGHVQIRVYAG